MKNSIVYDKAKYHLGAENFPKNLLPVQAYVHTGMFLGWIIDNNLFNKEFFDKLDIQKEIEGFRNRKISSINIYQNQLDGVLTDEDLNEEGNAFAQDYFIFDKGRYIYDYMKVFRLKADQNYIIEDTWTNYEKIKEVIDKRYKDWKNKKSGNFWSRLFS